MRRFVYILLALCGAGPALSCTVGETCAQVIAEKGKPASRIEAGPLQILSYPDATIKLRDDVVISIKVPEQAPPPVARLAPPRPSAGLPSAGPPSAPAAPWEAEASSAGVSWGSNFNAALEQAKGEKKHTLLLFTGSDWCGWSKKLHHEILRTDEFVQYAQEKLVLCEIDYPHHKAQSDELRAQNRMLEGRYNISGFPTVIVLDSTGKAVARLGYQEGGPGPFVAQIRAAGD